MEIDLIEKWILMAGDLILHRGVPSLYKVHSLFLQLSRHLKKLMRYCIKQWISQIHTLRPMITLRLITLKSNIFMTYWYNSIERCADIFLYVLHVSHWFHDLLVGNEKEAMEDDTITLDVTNRRLLEILREELHKARGLRSQAKENYDSSEERKDHVLNEIHEHAGPLVDEINELLTETDQLNALAKQNHEMSDALRKFSNFALVLSQQQMNSYMNVL